MSHIFVSYSRRDLETAQKIIDALAGNKLDTWIDWKSIPKGEDWEQEIYRGIEQADAFLFLISPASVTSEMCNKEIAHAVKNGKRILPIFIANVDNQQVYGVTEKFQGQEQKEQINRRNFIFCREVRDDFGKAMEEIKTTIHIDYEWLRYQTALQVEALEWEHHKDASRLLRGEELREAEYQLAVSGSQKDPPPTQLQRQFILASQRNEVRIRRQITGGLVAGLVIMLILSFVAWEQRNSAVEEATGRATAQWNAEANANEAERQAKIARIGELAAQSTAMQQKDREISFLLGIEAFRLGDTVRSRAALMDAANANSQLCQDPMQSRTGDTGSLLCDTFKDHTGCVHSVAFSPDGKILASGSADRTIRLWDVETRQPIGQPLKEHTDIVYSVAFSPDGKTLASGSEDKTIILWDVEDPQNPQPIGQPLSGQSGAVFTIAFSPDGKMLASGGGDQTNKTIILWDMETRQPLGQPLSGDSSWVWSVAFSPDGKTLASGGGSKAITLWDLETRKPIGRPMNGHMSFINSVAFSPDGKTLASGSWDSNLVLWDMERYPPIDQPLPGYSDSVQSVAFSPDGKMLALGTVGNAILLWDVETRQPVDYLLRGHTSPVRSIAFTPDGKTLASSSEDNAIILWDLDPQSWIEKSCQNAGRNLTHAEWERYFSPDEAYRKTCEEWPLEPE